MHFLFFFNSQDTGKETDRATNCRSLVNNSLLANTKFVPYVDKTGETSTFKTSVHKNFVLSKIDSSPHPIWKKLN